MKEIVRIQGNRIIFLGFLCGFLLKKKVSGLFFKKINIVPLV